MSVSDRLVAVQSAAFASRDTLSALMVARFTDGDVDAATVADNDAVSALTDALMNVFHEVSA